MILKLKNCILTFWKLTIKNMKIEKLKLARSSRSWEMFVNSPTIREFAPDIKTVSVKVQIVFNTAVCEPIIKEYKRELNP